MELSCFFCKDFSKCNLKDEDLGNEMLPGICVDFGAVAVEWESGIFLR